MIEQGSERQIAGYRDAAVAVRQVPFRDRVPVLGGLLGAALGARTWHHLNAGLRVIASTVVPLLRPVEEMDKHGRTVAARAREAHSQRLNSLSRRGQV